MRPFVPADVKALTGWLTPAAQTLRQADALADMGLRGNLCNITR
jgi:hypothetical protein